MVMKLIWQNNNGDEITIVYDKSCITDSEVDLDADLALEALFETLKSKIKEENNHG